MVSAPVAVLDVFGVEPDALLGYGGEARVYALDRERILRVHHEGTPAETVEARTRLLDELAEHADRVPFAIPTVLETRLVAGHVVTLEERLPGRPLTQVLDEASGEGRASLVRTYLDTAQELGELGIERSWYGDLSRPDALHTATFREYLEQRAADSLRRAGADFSSIDPSELATALPEPPSPEFVHMDAFPGNMLADGEAVTAVLDFGVVALMGDRRLDPLTAAAYLADDIARVTTDSDRAVAHEWLVARGLADLFLPAQRWCATFWSFARNDARLHQWCRSVLLD